MELFTQLEERINHLLDLKNQLARENTRLKSDLDLLVQNHAVLEQENRFLNFQIKRERQARHEAMQRILALLRKIGEYEKVG